MTRDAELIRAEALKKRKIAMLLNEPCRSGYLELAQVFERAAKIMDSAGKRTPRMSKTKN